MDLDWMESDACLALLLAARGHVPSLGPLNKRIVYCVRRALMSSIRTYNRREALLPTRVPMRDVGASASRYDRLDALLSSLSEDAVRAALSVIHGRPGRKDGVRRMMRRWGWGASRIAGVYREIQQALGEWS